MVVKCYRYGSAARKLFKARWNLRGLVEDHHVIPKQFNKHQAIKKFQFDTNSGKNLVMMPTPKGMAAFKNIREDRLVHGCGGHQPYNHFVRQLLDKVDSKNELDETLDFLKRNCRFNTDGIPWETNTDKKEKRVESNKKRK
jgi:hypothetical protein